MHFIVINIPQTFSLIDLRNYFSEFIEKDAINCFHYHHRPQYQLVDLIKCSAEAPPDSGTPGSDDWTTDMWHREDGDTAEHTNEIGESSFYRPPDTQAEKQNDSERTNPNTDSQGTTSLKTSSEETTGKESNSQETRNLKTSSQGNIDKESYTERTTNLKANFQGNTGKASDSPGTTSIKTSSQRNAGKKGGSICSKAKVQGVRNASDNSSTHYPNSDVADLAALKKKQKKENKKKAKLLRRQLKKEKQQQAKILKKIIVKEEKKRMKLGQRIQWHNPAVRNSEEKVSNEKTSKICHRKITQREALYNLMVEEAPGRTCAPVDMKKKHAKTFFKKYNHKHWVTVEGDILPQRCYLLRVNFRDPGQGKGGTKLTVSSKPACPNVLPRDRDSKYMQKDNPNLNKLSQVPSGDNKTQQELSTPNLELNHPQNPTELQPSPVMPQGNVGTPTRVFLRLLRTRKVPVKLLKSLGIECSKDSMGNITHCQEDTKTEVEGDVAFTAAGHLIPSSADFEEERKRRRMKDNGVLHKDPKMELEEKAENGPEMQKLQQHEPFHEDVTLQDRIKERHFEEALEMMWEEGGTGIIFDTNPRFWWGHEQKPKQWPVGDEDECSLQQSVSKMKKEKGKGSSCGAEEDKIRNRKPPPAKPPHAVNSFQAHMKGFGGQIIDAHGLQESQGLGLGMISMPLALESNGQHSHEHNGLRFTDCSLPHKLKREGNTSTHGAMNAKKLRKNAHSASDPTPPTTIGSFEAHTKGIGRRIMEALGWKEGQGLGKELSGRPYAIECNGQNFHGRKGIGFHGKKLRGGVSTTSTTKGKPQPSNAEFSNNPQIPTTTDEPQPPNAELRNPTQKISSITGKLQPLLADLSQHTQTSSTTGKPQPLQANLSKPFNFTVFHRAEDAQPSASTTHNT